MSPRKRADNLPKPVALSPSGEFDGNDGRWSSFYVNIGDADATGRGQNFKVLISTSSPLTLVPSQASWCNPDCAAKRGAQIFDGSQSQGFDPEKSQSWKDAGIFNLPLPHWWSEGDINATYGSENVGLGESSKDSPILTQQYVARYDSQKLFMGSFGLSQTSIKSGTGSQPPFLVNFAGFNNIPSISYGYGAGASYRNSNKGIPGNVVLGGYDGARIKMQNALNLTMPSDKNNTLVVGVASILYKPNQNVEANTFSFTSETKGFLATIDSTLPYLLLPDKVCDLFVERFGLQLDNGTGLYTVSDQSLRQNRQQNATVSFKITKDAQDTTVSNNFTTINLPYDAFDLQASYPLTNGSDTIRYFPIKKSRNGIFVLGRAFLQESYLVVDYDRSTFSVAPAVYSDPMPEQKLVPIYNKTTSPPSTTPTVIPQGGDGGLAPGAIAGIVVGIVVAFLLAALGYFLWWRRRRAAQAATAAEAAPPYTEKPPEMDTVAAGSEIKSHRVSELDSEPPNSPRPSIGGYYDGRGAKESISPFPPISEMESPPAELYSPPLVASTPRSEGGGSDYFIAGGKLRQHGRNSSGNNTPGTPAAVELPGDDGKYQVGGVHFDPIASPKLSPAATHTKIDEVVARNEASPERKPNLEKVKEENESQPGSPLERRPSSHQRGLSDTTVQSDDTAVSAMTPEEMERWAMGNDNSPTRPLSE
ncbi:acid protease [Periconia macrospinosa]|uniref:Acid protease n=1 Tax=Periconia macrospinosa TaxID=97972 RepID=A0A2V1D825_9PLEO|nr:acid protease [Periconia macrospinosa]